jgi:lipid-binding SYLF domain-containing protein
MKTTTLGLIMMGFAVSTLAIDKAELENRIHTLTANLEAMQLKPDKSIPADHLRKARGILLLERTKAGFLFAYQGGSGVALVRDTTTDRWGPAAFLGANEASLGFQVGGQQSFIVVLLMDTNATRLLTEPTFEFGGEARGTAGVTSSGVEGKVSTPEPSVLVYDDRKGLYGGAAIKAGAIAPDDEANRVYYGKPVTVKEILFGHVVEPTQAASDLAGKLNEYSKRGRGSAKLNQ